MTQNEIHNRIAPEIVASIVRPPLDAGGGITDILIVLESVIVGVILSNVMLGGDEIVLDGGDRASEATPRCGSARRHDAGRERVMQQPGARTLLTTASGRMVDLLDPRPSDISFADIAEHLSKANRYCGATRGLAYSVAEHSVRCADAAIAVGDPQLAAYLLCHDMHEAYLGDDVTPKKRALAAVIEGFGVLAGEVERAFGRLVNSLDVAIHAAAGLTFPRPPQVERLVHHFDRMLLATEWRDLMRCDPPYDLGAALPRPIEVWPWNQARDTFARRCVELLPTQAKGIA